MNGFSMEGLPHCYCFVRLRLLVRRHLCWNTGAHLISEMESGSRFARRPHLSDDETVAKMGHPDLDVGHPSQLRFALNAKYGIIVR
jgi:hypothetical protein